MNFPKRWALGKLQLKSSVAFKINVIFLFPALYFQCSEGNRWKQGKPSRVFPKFEGREEHQESSKFSCWKSAIHVSTKGFFWSERWHEPRIIEYPELEGTHEDQSTTPASTQKRKRKSKTPFYQALNLESSLQLFLFLSRLHELNSEVTPFSNLIFP